MCGSIHLPTYPRTPSTQVAKTLSEDTSYFLRNFAQGAGALGMMLYTSPQLCALMLGVIPPVAMWGVFFGR